MPERAHFRSAHYRSNIGQDRLDRRDRARPGVLRAERLVNMSEHKYQLERNPNFTPDQKWVVLRSNMFGPAYVFAAEVAKAARPYE